MGQLEGPQFKRLGMMRKDALAGVRAAFTGTAQSELRWLQQGIARSRRTPAKVYASRLTTERAPLRILTRSPTPILTSRLSTTGPLPIRRC